MGLPKSISMASVLRLAAFLASLVLVLGFLGFVSDEAGEGSRKQVAKLANVKVSPREEQARERTQGPVREALDDANDVLLKPFASLFSFDDPWPQRMLPTILALLVFGGGLTLLANFIPKPERTAGDWRTAR